MAGPTTVTLPMPDDWHVHLRDLSNGIFQAVAPFSGIQFFNNLMMPNLVPPLTTDELILKYAEKVLGSERSLQATGIHIALYLTHRTTPTTIWLAFAAGSRMAKYYPNSGTTNSSSGLSTPRDLDDGVLAMMEELGMVLCLHAELTPEDEPDPLRREYYFIPHLRWLVENYPRLKIVVEHVSDKRMLLEVLRSPDNVGATITAHHPFITHWDATHDPHCNCMPVAKRPEDRDFLADVILQTHAYPKIFFGSDSAPHPQSRKQAGAAGVWSSPVAIPVLFDHFDRNGGMGKWEAFQAFMCTNGANFYGVGPALERRPTITLRRETWQIPDYWPIGDHDKVDSADANQVLIPWLAGEYLDWRVEGMEWFGRTVED